MLGSPAYHIRLCGITVICTRNDGNCVPKEAKQNKVKLHDEDQELIIIQVMTKIICNDNMSSELL